MKSAIRVLRKNLDQCAEWEIALKVSLRQALAVLEAAEKADKKVSLVWLDKVMRLLSAHTGINQRLYEGEPEGIRALLESLPDAKE